MIRRAVEQRPDDGYIVDSLGWAYFRTGNYDEAVKNLERAVELKPEDPTINDHLGDAYWRVGRTLEAHFQWSHAKDLKPEPEELPKIEKKLKDGLPADTSSVGATPTKAEEEPATAGNGCPSPAPLRRKRAGQSQSDAAGARPPRRRLSRARKPGRVRRCRRPAELCAGRRARARRSAGRTRRRPARSADNLVLKAARALAARSPGTAAWARSISKRACRSPPGLAADRPMRPRRCACSRGPTASRPTIRASMKRRARPAPTCRSVSIRARG